MSNPWEVLDLRRKIKQYAKRGIPESMKTLSRLRALGLTKEMVVATEVTRTLVWVCERTKDFKEDEDLRKFNVMVRFLLKEYKKVLGVSERKAE